MDNTDLSGFDSTPYDHERAFSSEAHTSESRLAALDAARIEDYRWRVAQRVELHSDRERATVALPVVMSRKKVRRTLTPIAIIAALLVGAGINEVIHAFGLVALILRSSGAH